MKLVQYVPRAAAGAALLVIAAPALSAGLDADSLTSTEELVIDQYAPAPGPASASGTGSPPRSGPNVQVNAPQQALPNGLLGRSETSIASTANGQQLVAGWNDAQGFCGVPFGAPCTPPANYVGLSGYAWSSNGGLAWTDGDAPPVFADNTATRGDPWLDSGGVDNDSFYFANLAIDAATGASRGVIVHRGAFTNGTFSWYDAAVFDSPRNASTPGTDFYDKEALVAEKGGSSVYVSLTNFQETCGIAQWGWGTVEVWRSHDGGATWQGPAIASPDQSFVTDPSDPDCGAEGVLQQSSVPAIGPDGTVYVVWQFGPTFTPLGTSADADIVVARSTDGGATFEPFVKVADINSSRNSPPVAYSRSRINDHPRIAVAQSGPNRGRVYVTFYSLESPVSGLTGFLCPADTPTPTATCIVQNTVSSGIYVAYSDDRGETWSTPAQIGGSVPATGVKRFWPVVTVQPSGVVDLVYYESQEKQATEDPTDTECFMSTDIGFRRAGPVSSLMDTYRVQSVNGGVSFGAPVKVSDQTTNWCTVVSNIRPNMGDYIGSAAGSNRILPAWADGRNGVPDTFFSSGQTPGQKSK
jgi:hypothetical protein